MQRARRPRICCGVLAALTLVGCAEPRTPETVLLEVEARLAAADPAAAQQLLREALADSPGDARLRIALARADLALGDAAAAEGSLHRALALGAAKEEV